MSLVLAIEPDSHQAAILKRITRDKVKAEFVQVDSRDAAVAAISARMPDVILVTALMSPRDEEELIAHLRSLEGAEHVQTHTIPQLALSALSARAAEWSAALQAIVPVIRRTDATTTDDPWWRYDTSHTRGVEVRFTELYRQTLTLDGR